MNLRGRTILISGGSSGIGLAFALKFAELGNEVIVTGRRQAVLDEVKAKYPKLHTIQSDAADLAQIAALAVRVKANFPKLDVLMNNAVIMLHKNLTAPAADPAGLMAEMNINVGGVIGMTSAFIDNRAKPALCLFGAGAAKHPAQSGRQARVHARTGRNSPGQSVPCDHRFGVDQTWARRIGSNRPAVAGVAPV